MEPDSRWVKNSAYVLMVISHKTNFSPIGVDHCRTCSSLFEEFLGIVCIARNTLPELSAI